MVKLNALLTRRLRKSPSSNKMSELAKTTSAGEATPFSGLFGVNELSQETKETLRNLLVRFQKDDANTIEDDLHSLARITSEVRAITNQAALLHGERLKKAQTILKEYQEGAFTAYLVATYGNRQTPYNFLQYYDFHQSMPKTLHPQIEKMPRQAIYTLASRQGEMERKQEIVEHFSGQTKQQLLEMIRDTFPLADHDKRKPNPADGMIHSLRRLRHLVRSQARALQEEQRRQITEMIDEIRNLLVE